MIIKKLIPVFLLVLCLTATIHAETISLPLQKFTASSTFDLHCISDSQHLSIPVPERWKVNKATLSLHYSVSNSLDADSSQLIVKVNGDPIAQTKLNPLTPNAMFDVSIPLSHLKPGYNTITIQVSQHAASHPQCEAPCAPDLWTNVSLKESSLRLEYDLKPLPLKLGEVVGLLFDPKQFPEAAVNIVTEEVTPESVTLAGIVASGIARRFDYRKVKFDFSQEIKPGMDNVLIGSVRFANGMVSPNGQQLASPDTGGILKILHVPNKNGSVDDKHAVIVIAGENPAALKVAAETFTSMSLPYPGTAEMRTYSFNMSDITMYGGREVLVADKIHTFNTLNRPTFSFNGLYDGPIVLTFRLPADFLIKQNQYAKLSMNLSYGAGLRPDSAINIAINNKPLRSIQLDSASGSYLEGYKIDIPTYLFKPGVNTISISPHFSMLGRQLCDVVQEDGIFATIYENSTLYFPAMPHFVELPKVELFTLNGFPFTRWPDGYETMIYLPQQNTASINTALNIIGMITQKNGFPLFSTQVKFDEPKGWEGEMLVIGKASSIPKPIMDVAPMGLAGIANVPYPVSRGWESETAMSKSKQQSGLGRGTGAIMEFESLFKRGRSMLLLTAENDEDMLLLGDAMLEPDVQGLIKGDVALIDLTTADYRVVSMMVGKKYTTSEKGDISFIDSFLHKYPYIFYGLGIFAILALSTLGYKGLRRYRAKREAAPEIQPD